MASIRLGFHLFKRIFELKGQREKELEAKLESDRIDTFLIHSI